MIGEHTVVVGSDRVPMAGAKALGRVNPNVVLEVTLKLRRGKEIPELKTRPAQISHAQLAADYGATQADLDLVIATFTQLGLTCTASSAATRTVQLSGTVKAMESAFAVQLFDYAHPQGGYRGRVGAVHVPTAVKDIVTGVFGLDDRRVAHRRKRTIASLGKTKHVSAVPPSWWTPAQLAAHYKFPAGAGAGQTVGLLEFGGGYFASDLQGFCSAAKIAPLPIVKPVSVDGTPTDARDGAEGEVMLDVEVVAGACPQATIVVYFAEFTEKGWIAILDAAVHDKVHNPGVLSVSWGYTEDQDIWTHAAMTAVNEALKDAALLGITICVASGDDGSSDAIMDGHAHVNFPASSPYVLAVGGTTVLSKTGGAADVVWKEGDGLRSDNHGSSGGGVSTVFARPAWQSAVTIKSVNSGALLGRCLPDLSANADWDASPYLLYVDGQAEPNGGTSAATPLVAALIALINGTPGRDATKRVGYVTPLLYQASGDVADKTIGAACCTDVTSGNNTTAKVGGYPAAAGYDAATGWGTPIGTELAKRV